MALATPHDARRSLVIGVPPPYHNLLRHARVPRCEKNSCNVDPPCNEGLDERMRAPPQEERGAWPPCPPCHAHSLGRQSSEVTIEGAENNAAELPWFF
ncbi:hypothetical protein SEVIR_1G014701v4 [Setaria viridis]